MGNQGKAHSAKGGGTDEGVGLVSKELQCRVLEELFKYILLEHNVGGKMVSGQRGGWGSSLGPALGDPQEDPKTC